MARKPTHDPLNVYLNGRLVGRLRRESTARSISSTTQAGLAGTTPFRFPCRCPCARTGTSAIRSLPSLKICCRTMTTFGAGLPNGRRRKAPIPTASLRPSGRDCVGALQFLPDGVAVGQTGVIDARPVSDEEIAKIVSDLARSPLGVGEDQEFRISLAGAQEKTALLYWDDKWQVPHGTTATTHILKPQIGRLPNGIDLSNSVENEHFCLELVAALGLPVAKSQIVDFAGKRVLSIERFDRTRTRDGRLLRLPQEDCCQALSVPPSRKYRVGRRSRHPRYLRSAQGKRRSRRRSKDFSSRRRSYSGCWVRPMAMRRISASGLSPGGRFRLTPLYDIVSAQPSLDAKQISQNQMKLAMAVGTNRHYVVHTILGRHFKQTADACGLPAKALSTSFKSSAIRRKQKIDETLSKLPPDFPAAVAQSISDGAKRRIGALAAA